MTGRRVTFTSRISRNALASANYELDTRGTIRTQRYRYIEWLEAITEKIVERELYDHKLDPDENENRAEQSDVVNELHDQMWRELPAPPVPFPFAKPAITQ
jgi:hypothetical protein